MRVKIKILEAVLVFNVLASTTLFLYVQDHFPKDHKSYFLVAVITLFCAVSLLSFIKISPAMWNFIAFFFSVLFLKMANDFVKNMNSNRGEVDFGISNTVYNGHSLKAPLVLTLIILLLGLIVGAVNALIQKKVEAPETTSNHSFKFFRLNNVTILGMLFVYCLLTAVQVSSIVQNQINSYGTNLSFDFLNFATWQKFHEIGLSVMKDFWYPYGGMIWFQDSRIGPIFVLVSLLILLTCILLPILQSKKINIYQIVILICLNYLVSTDWFNALRYAFPFVSILVFIREFDSRLIRITMSIPLSVVWWLSPEVAVLCLALFLLEFLRIKFTSGTPKTKINGNSEKFIIPLLSLSLYFGYSYSNSSLANTFSFLIRPSETSQLSSSIDFGIGTGNLYFIWSNFALQLMLIVALIGLIKSVIDSHLHIQKPIILNVHILNYFCLILFITYFLLKDSTRSGMLTPGLFCTLIFILFELSFRKVNLLQKQILIALITWTILLGNILQPSIQGVSELGSSLKNVFASKNQNDLIESKKIDPEFSLALQVSGDESLKNSIFVLGDRSTFYWETDKKPYWTISNWSTYSDQKRLLEQLNFKVPTYVYLDRREATLNFDRVPAVLRNISIYRWVIDNYSFKASLTDGDLLIKSPNNASQVDWSYWNKVLGTNLDIGYLGNAFSLNVDCSSDLSLGSNCKEDLYVPTNEAYGKLILKCNENIYTINYLNRDKDLILPKNQIWFWRNGCKLL